MRSLRAVIAAVLLAFAAAPAGLLVGGASAHAHRVHRTKSHGARRQHLSASRRRAGARARSSSLEAPCENTQLTPTAVDLQVVRTATVCLINKIRADHGEQPLSLDPALEQAAEAHSEEMAARDYFAHVSPSGETPLQRILSSGYASGSRAALAIGENIAWGTLELATPSSIVQAWMASPAHRANILEGRYRETGMGIAPQVPFALAEGQPGAIYAQEFGVIR